MSLLAHKRLPIILGIACVGLLALCGGLLWSHGWLTIRVAWASEQTKIFEEMRTRALQSNTSEAAGCLRYVVHYYESGSKQETGSRLDQMVERERQRAAQDIIAYLRTKTGQDLGESPEAWIQTYVQK